MRYKYTDKEQQEIIDSMVVMIDTREKEGKHDHIINYLDKKKISYNANAKIDSGDYSFYIPKNEKLGICRDIYFDKEIVIERKQTLNELARNLSKGRAVFENELLRRKTCKFYLLVENGSWDHINKGEYICYEDAKEAIEKMKKRKATEKEIKEHLEKYTSHFKPESYLATLFTYQSRYDISINFAKRYLAGQFIHKTFYYYLREKLKDF